IERVKPSRVSWVGCVRAFGHLAPTPRRPSTTTQGATTVVQQASCCANEPSAMRERPPQSGSLTIRRVGSRRAACGIGLSHLLVDDVQPVHTDYLGPVPSLLVWEGCSNCRSQLV